MSTLVELVARFLEPDERAAVLGDILELNDTGLKALRGILGLVIRRQIEVWKQWRSWLALVGIVGFVGPRLYQIALDATSPVFIDIRTYWKVGSVYSSGMTIGEEFFRSLILALGLLLWSWVSGFVLARLSPKTFWLTGTLYFAIWTLPSLLAVTNLVIALTRTICLCLLVVPSYKGIRYARQNHSLPFSNAVLLAFVTLCLLVLATWTGGFPQAAVTRWAGGTWDPGPGWSSRLLFYAILASPVAYLLLTSKAQPFAKLRRHGEFRG